MKLLKNVDFKSVSIYRQKCFEFRNDIFRKYLFRNYDHFLIKTQIFMIFDMFEIFDTICMCLVHGTLFDKQCKCISLNQNGI